MEFKNEISHFVHEIWSSVLRLPVTQTNQSFPSSGLKDTVAGYIQITGEWQGTVVMYCSKNLAEKFASIMWSLEESEIEFDQIQDAIGELTNMAGGNIKALLPPPCQLSLPIVANSNFDPDIPDNHLLSSVNFECEGSVFAISMVEEDTIKERLRA